MNLDYLITLFPNDCKITFTWNKDNSNCQCIVETPKEYFYGDGHTYFDALESIIKEQLTYL